MPIKHYYRDQELVQIRGMRIAEFRAKFPDAIGVRYDGASYMVGLTLDTRLTWDHALSRYVGDVLPVERVIEYKKNPSRHQCDARCLNAKGRTMKCECSCGGKNHGRGSLVCR